MPQAVASNPWLLRRAQQARADLAAGAILRLFKNDFTPLSQSLLAAFTQADFAGYAGVDVGALFAAPVLVVNGEYQSQTTIVEFDATSGAQLIYGWYLDRGDDSWHLAKRWDAPVTIDPDHPICIRIRATDWSRHLFP